MIFKESMYDGIRRCVSVSHVLAPRARLYSLALLAICYRATHCALINTPGKISRLCRACLTAVNIGIITATLTLSAGTVCCVTVENLKTSMSFQVRYPRCVVNN